MDLLVYYNVTTFNDSPHYSKDNPYGLTEFQRFLQQNPEYAQEIIQKHQNSQQKTPQKTPQDDQEYMPKTSSHNQDYYIPKMPPKNNPQKTYPINQKFIPKKFPPNPVNPQNLRDNPQ